MLLIRLHQRTYRTCYVVLLVAAAWPTFTLAAPPEDGFTGRYPGFDGYARPITTDVEESQAWFNQGIQLLYGYNHDEAIRSFRRAAELDPSCAMAWWGEAYARGLHINNPQMTEAQSELAHQAAQRALEALDDEQPVEQALVRAVAQRYCWPAPEDRGFLDEAYAEAMQATWHAFPEDPDVGALYAEALMNLQPWDLWTATGEPKGRVLEVLSVLQHTLSVSPRHPGANHFYIHAIEASPWPQLGVASAERLVDLVPGSGHLVHMPAHIFIRTGQYHRAAEANQRAIAADRRYFQSAPSPEFYSIYYLHNLHFLAYAAMMEGRFEIAMKAAREIEQEIPREFLKSYVTLADGFMPTSLHVLIRFGKWDQILLEPEPEPWRLFSRAEWHFARSLAFAALNRCDEASQESVALQSVSESLNDEWRMGNNRATEVLAVAARMAEGEIAFRRGDRKDAFRLLEEAVELEDSLQYDEPPGWMQPVRHALGALLLADHQFARAEQVYQQDLLRHPQNAWSLLGLQQSLGMQGKTELADAMRVDVDRAWIHADVKPVASCYCHPDALLQP